MKISTVCLWVFVAWALLAVVDMWFDVVSWGVFVKITITLGVLIGLLAVIGFSRRSDRE